MLVVFQRAPQIMQTPDQEIRGKKMRKLFTTLFYSRSIPSSQEMKNIGKIDEVEKVIYWNEILA